MSEYDLQSVGTDIAQIAKGIQGTTAFGIVKSVTAKIGKEKHEIFNEGSNVVGLIFTNPQTEVSADLIMRVEDTGTGPNAADPIGIEVEVPTHNAATKLKFIIDNVDRKWEAGKEVGMTVSGVFYPNVKMS